MSAGGDPSGAAVFGSWSEIARVAAAHPERLLVHAGKAIAPDVLRHRVLTTYEAEAEEGTSDQIVQRILGKIESP